MEHVNNHQSEEKDIDVLISGSMSLSEQWLKVADELSEMGLKVDHPIAEEGGFDWNNASDEAIAVEKKKYIDHHLKKILGSRAILLFNAEKKGMPGYIGPNSFLEMGVAYALGVPVYLYEKPNPEQDHYYEVIGLMPTVIDHDLGRLASEVKELKNYPSDKSES